MLMNRSIPRSLKVVPLVALVCVALLVAWLAPRRSGAGRTASVQELQLKLRQLRGSTETSHAARPTSLRQLREKIRALKRAEPAAAVSKEELERRLEQLRRS